jgi:hypothetical protein
VVQPEDRRLAGRCGAASSRRARSALASAFASVAKRFLGSGRLEQIGQLALQRLRSELVAGYSTSTATISMHYATAIMSKRLKREKTRTIELPGWALLELRRHLRDHGPFWKLHGDPSSGELLFRGNRDAPETVMRNYAHWLRDDRSLPATIVDRMLAPTITEQARWATSQSTSASTPTLYRRANGHSARCAA